MVQRLLLLFTFNAAFLVYSQGYQVNFQGQKQQGMASAGTGLLTDGAALFFNPGSAAHLKGSSINAGFTPIFSNVLFEENGTNGYARTENPMGTPFSFYAVYKKNESSRLAAGMAIYTPFGSTVQWEEGWMGRFVLTRLKLKSIFYQPTISYKITDKLGLGVGFVFCSGDVSLQKDIPVQSNEQVTIGDTYASAELTGSAIGFGANAGIYFKPVEKLSLGLTYRSQVNMSVADGQATFNVSSSLDPNFPDGKFSSSLPLPQVITFGVGYRPSDKLSLALDVNYIGWKAYDTLAFDYENNTASLVDTRSARMYENTFAFRFGAQFEPINGLSVRAGVAFAMTPVQSGYVTPETPDNNRVNSTLGLGYQVGDHFELDASILFTRLQRTDTNLESGLSGTFTTIVVAPGIGLIYKL